MVISLLTEPGSYTSVNDVADGASTGATDGAAPEEVAVELRLTGTAGGSVLPGAGMVSSASARISPVLEFMSRAMPVLGLGGHDGLGQGLLGVVLQGLVDAEDQVLAGDGRPVLLATARDLVAVRVDLGHGLARPARQRGVVLVLEAAQPASRRCRPCRAGAGPAARPGRTASAPSGCRCRPGRAWPPWRPWRRRRCGPGRRIRCSRSAVAAAWSSGMARTGARAAASAAGSLTWCGSA